MQRNEQSRQAAGAAQHLMVDLKNRSWSRRFLLCSSDSYGAPTFVGPEGDDRGLVVHDIDQSLLFGNHLDSVLVQLPPPKTWEIEANVPRQAAHDAVCALLVGQDGSDPLLDIELNEPALVLLPEFAFTGDQWGAIDELVRSYQRAVVLVAGFGIVTGVWLKDWAEGKGETRRHFDETPVAGQTYNGLWCWVHQPAPMNLSTHCFCALKNHLEQRHEALAVSGLGRRHLALKFKDLMLLPAVCAELLQNAKNSAQSRYRHLLETTTNPSNVLITGSLYQTLPTRQDVWTTAVSDLISLDRERVLVMFANQALDEPVHDEDKDRWRGRSGVFAHITNPMPDCGGSPFGRPVQHQVFAGGVARCPKPSLLFTRLQWPPYGAMVGRRPWNVIAGRFLPEGARSPLKAHCYEAQRYFLRAQISQMTPQQEEGIGKIKEVIEAGQQAADRLSRTCLDGVGPEREFTADPLQQSELTRLQASAEVIAHLVGGEMELNAPAEYVGPLAYQSEDLSANVLVWHSRRSAGELRRELQDWMNLQQPHLPLVVFGSGHGRITEGFVAPIATGGAAPAGDQDIGEPQEEDNFLGSDSKRIAVLLDVAHVTACFAGPEEREEAEVALYKTIQDRVRETG
jgi:hypothetical protein